MLQLFYVKLKHLQKMLLSITMCFEFQLCCWILVFGNEVVQVKVKVCWEIIE